MPRSPQPGRRSTRGSGPRLTPAERADYLTRLADGLGKRQAELAELITEELGCPLFLSQVYQAVAPVMSFNYAAEVGRSLQTAEVRISDLSPLAASSAGGSIIPMAGASLVVKEPVGVVASFPAYNFALAAIGQKVGPALVAGCTVVVKVTEPNPLATFVVGEVCAEIGLPPGVLNIVAARPAESEYLVRHPGVDMVSFTGSHVVGAKIAAACGELIRPCVLELGGKSAAIVLEDAELEDVLPVLIGTSVGTNSGQSCVAQTRLLVPESQYDTYAEALAEGFASLKVGDPMDADTVVGPLVTASHRDRVEHYVDLARKEGATIATGGRRPPHLDRGWYYEPTLITNADNDMRVSREEIFGPVASLIPHRGEDDAVRIANDSELGLAGSVFTQDTEHGFEIARRVRTGYSEHALLFNLAGERFVDETVGDHLTTIALMAQPEARGLLVADARVHREWITGSYVAGIPGIDKFALAQRRGARCAIAESTAEFADMPEEWGYDGARIRAAIDKINKSGRAPEPDRRYDPAPLTEPPFYVVETRPAVTFPFTGVRIDASARVLGSDGHPVPGLFAAGADAGGLYRGAYAGGVAPAVVFGLAAADAIAPTHPVPAHAPRLR